MGREVRRVPLDFDWPIDKIWHGFLMPDRLIEDDCTACEGSGFSPEAKRMKDRWYGYVPFDPAETGSEPFTVDTPEVRAFAERNVSRSPGFYGSGEDAVVREAQRLLELWNGCWSHHLAQEDVDALIAEGRLHNFTHSWSKEDREWRPIEPAPVVTAARINRWSLTGLGHDAINCLIVVQAKCEREGWAFECAVCGGHGNIERYPGQRKDAEAWEPTDPPVGDGWQLWSTTSEGSPMTPPFSTAQDLARHCAAAGVSVFGSETVDYARWLAIIAGEDFAHVEVAPGVILL